MKQNELKRMKKDELLALARRRGLDATARMRKDELVDLIAAAPKRPAKAKTAAKAKPKAAAKTKRKPAAKAKTKAAAKKTAAKKTAPTRKPTAKKAAAKRKTARRKAAAPAAREKRLARPTIRDEAVASKFYLGAEEQAMPSVEGARLPDGYGRTGIVAMVRDPYWLFTYWEIAPADVDAARKALGKDAGDGRMILRVFDRGPGPTTHNDVELSGGASNWYLNVEPGRHYRIAIGLLGPDGRFEEIAITGDIATPRAGVSEESDERWMVPDEEFRRIVAASGGYDAATRPGASGEMREKIERRLLEQMGSGAVSSLGSGGMPGPARERGFRLWVATELILYGATEPDARVTVRGEEISLRGDGTFSLRFALPDGTIDLPVVAVSGDEVEERSIDTTVRKASKEKAPVIR